MGKLDEPAVHEFALHVLRKVHMAVGVQGLQFAAHAHTQRAAALGGVRQRKAGHAAQSHRSRACGHAFKKGTTGEAIVLE